MASLLHEKLANASLHFDVPHCLTRPDDRHRSLLPRSVTTKQDHFRRMAIATVVAHLSQQREKAAGRVVRGVGAAKFANLSPCATKTIVARIPAGQLQREIRLHTRTDIGRCGRGGRPPAIGTLLVNDCRSTLPREFSIFAPEIR
jgi:hypothetical protein